MQSCFCAIRTPSSVHFAEISLKQCWNKEETPPLLRKRKIKLPITYWTYTHPLRYKLHRVTRRRSVVLPDVQFVYKLSALTTISVKHDTLYLIFKRAIFSQCQWRVSWWRSEQHATDVHKLCLIMRQHFHCALFSQRKFPTIRLMERYPKRRDLYKLANIHDHWKPSPLLFCTKTILSRELKWM